MVDGLYQAGGYVCFVPIDFVGIFGGRIRSVDETQSVGGHQLFVGIIGVVMPPFKWGLLVCNGHYVELAAVEMLVGKVADCGVHTSLTMEHGMSAVAMLSGIEAFEK